MSDADAASRGLAPVHDFDAHLVVEVRNRFDSSWSHGFEIVECVGGGGPEPRFRLRRLSDGHVLPALFSADDVIVNPSSTRGPD